MKALSPSRGDSFSSDSGIGRNYREIMIEEDLKREEISILRKINEKKEIDGISITTTTDLKEQRRKRRWDDNTNISGETPVRASSWDAPESLTLNVTNSENAISRWDITPQVGEIKSSRNRWDETPLQGSSDQTPSTKKR